MSDHTLEAPGLRIPDAPPRERIRRQENRLLVLARRYPWVLGAIALLIVSLIVVLWARARPGYDPYGWLVWGKLSIHLKLDTNGAPSWKPLPFLFTVPMALFGRYQLWLWMVFAVGVSLAGPLFAWRIAFRLTDADPARRYAGYVAGLFAAVFVFLTQDPVGHYNYTHYILSAESDTMIVALCLIAIDLHLSRRHQSAFWIWWLGALGRPEVWPYWVLCGLYLWRTHPEYRRWLYVSVVLLLFMWFGIPGITSKSFLTAGNIAENSPRAVHGNKVVGVLARFHDLQSTTVWVLAGLSVLLAAYRRQLTILVLTAGAALWVVIEAAMALHGWPAVPRYMFEPGAVVAVLAGIFIGRVVLEGPGIVSRLIERLGAARLGPRRLAAIGGWSTGLVVLVIAGSLFPAAHHQFRLEHTDLDAQRQRTVLIGRLSGFTAVLGGTKMLACGQPNIPIEYQSMLAWYMDIKVGELYVAFAKLKVDPHPLINIYPIAGNGWEAFTSGVTPAKAAACNAVVPAGKHLFYHGH
jgi:hypothetical protein